MGVNWARFGVVVGALAALGAVLSQLDSCLTERVEAAVDAHAASREDVSRLERKIDTIYDFLLHQQPRR
jgi:hypothetical protein